MLRLSHITPSSPSPLGLRGVPFREVSRSVRSTRRAAAAVRLQNEIDTCLRINLANEAIHTVRERVHACKSVRVCVCLCVLRVWVSERAVCVCVWLRACVRVCAFVCV